MSALKATFSPLVHLFQNPSERFTESPLIATSTFVVAALGVASILLLRTKKDGKIRDLGGIHLVTAWTFFTRRWDFIRDNFARTGGNNFRFRVLQHRVIALNGEKYRKAFFDNSSLDASQGYSILMGGAPDLECIDVEKVETARQEFIKRILTLVRKDRVVETFPVLLDDLNRRMLGWGKEGKVNPFREVYDLVFQMTVRLATCQELSEDQEAVGRLAEHYWNLEKSATPVAVLLPWFPGPAKKSKAKATMGLYTLLGSYVQLRRNASTPTTDPIDFLIGQGLSDSSIIQSIMGIIFAGVINTGITSCWALLHLGTNPTWKARAIDEYKALVNKHTDTLSSEPLHRRLAAVPLSAWENELPSVDLIIRETLRMSSSFAALRRNLVNELKVDDVIIKPGDFLLYSMGTLHMDPNIYTDPSKFDPDRYLEGREEDRKEVFAYAAWGAGRHPCPGMKVAKLEMKVVLALILLGYEYEVVDESGKFPKSLPEINRNDLQTARPLGDQCYLKFKRVTED